MKRISQLLKTLSLAVISLAAVCCTQAPKDMSVTEKGVGALDFYNENVDMGKAYDVKLNIIEEPRYGVRDVTTKVYNKKGDLVAVRSNFDRIQLFGQEFVTDKGIRVGTPIRDVIKQYPGGMGITSDVSFGRTFLFFSDNGTIGFTVDGDKIRGGFEEYYMDPFTPTIDDFDPDTKVNSIVVINM